MEVNSRNSQLFLSLLLSFILPVYRSPFVQAKFYEYREGNSTL